VVAAHGEVMALYIRIVAALQFTHAPPVNRGWISVLLVARHHAALAADALGHVKVEAILLAVLERPLRDQWPRLRLNPDQCPSSSGSDDTNQFAPEQRKSHRLANWRFEIEFVRLRHERSLGRQKLITTL